MEAQGKHWEVMSFEESFVSWKYDKFYLSSEGPFILGKNIWLKETYRNVTCYIFSQKGYNDWALIVRNTLNFTSLIDRNWYIN